MATCNPFKVGDKVRLKKSSYDFNPNFWGAYEGCKWAIVTGVYNAQVATNVDNKLTHYTHFDFYKEEKDMTQQTQQKTKRVPFTHELWEKYKDVAKIIYIPSGGEVLGFAYFPQADSRFRYVYLTRTGTAPMFGSGESFYLEIPVTTKRIPFNPELKDAKVLIEGDMLCFNTEIKEWHLFSNDFVALLDYEDNVRIKHRSRVQMEIEEDV